jgi:hypothetical protein
MAADGRFRTSSGVDLTSSGVVGFSVITLL